MSSKCWTKASEQSYNQTAQKAKNAETELTAVRAKTERSSWPVKVTVSARNKRKKCENNADTLCKKVLTRKFGGIYPAYNKLPIHIKTTINNS